MLTNINLLFAESQKGIFSIWIRPKLTTPFWHSEDNVMKHRCYSLLRATTALTLHKFRQVNALLAFSRRYINTFSSSLLSATRPVIDINSMQTNMSSCPSSSQMANPIKTFSFLSLFKQVAQAQSVIANHMRKTHIVAMVTRSKSAPKERTEMAPSQTLHSTGRGKKEGGSP